MPEMPDFFTLIADFPEYLCSIDRKWSWFHIPYDFYQSDVMGRTPSDFINGWGIPRKVVELYSDTNGEGSC